MSETLIIAIISGIVAFAVSISATAFGLWKWERGEKERMQAETTKLKNEGAKVLAEGAADLVENQQKQYEADVKELRTTVDDLRETLDDLRVDYKELLTEHKKIKTDQMIYKNMQDKKEALLLRQIQELKAAFDDWRDWANRLRQQVESAGLVPVPFKVRSSASDVIMDP
jgi:flagellar motility protein MotE (MotC chaperone)